ncbi:Beta-xylosidase [Aquisphaera giovannonii]|uniref:Beta-xylosidase n=1 Tax=Aquisphaera giovannonii TaxID=406548 RepID=A0A5B9WBK7_9BACT|nr:hypothetical protein [Aquisphaera giovannonii]QEH37425.1 Beta-xylosidase [Aquisphaera giovannonii]
MIRAARYSPWLALAALTLGTANGAEPVRLVVDASRVERPFRAIHGVNNGPIDVGGTVDLSGGYRELGIPSVRLHDTHWPTPDVVDMHVVFPDATADPSRPQAYDFAATDEYLKAVRATGARVVYRLGESIEHHPRKVHVHPPADPERWAAACLGVIRHVNDGWAGGTHLAIDDWEIWNEPDNRPNQWTGSDEDYFRLYATTARAIRREFPSLRVGGPAVGNVGTLQGGRFVPTPFVRRFLEECRRREAPLDFFSWHLYTPDPEAFGAMARAIRDMLDRLGFARTSISLTEWNYLPDGRWAEFQPSGQGLARERFFDRIGGAEGATFALASLLAMQDAPIDTAHYYAGDTNPFGLYTLHAVPKKTHRAYRAFRELIRHPSRLACSGGVPSHVAIAASSREDRDEIVVLVANLDARGTPAALRVDGLAWGDRAGAVVRMLDSSHDFDAPSAPVRLDKGSITLELPASSIAWMTIAPMGR